jgi:tetratricopeptide (TPR) repeat protein
MSSLRRSAAVLVVLITTLGLLPPALAQEGVPQARPAVRVLRTGGLKVESAALLVSGEQGGSIHVAVLPLFVPAAGGARETKAVRVPAVLEIDGATLLKGNTGELLRIEICLYALSAGDADAGSIEGSLLETVEVDLPRAGAAVERSGIQYAGELTLPPGRHSLRVLVRNALTGEVGLRILPLTVPDPAGSALLAPELANPAPDAWVAARPEALPGALPAAQPVLGAGQEVRAELPVWKLRSAEGLRIDGLHIEVLRPDGGHVADLPARIEARRAVPETPGLERLTVAFTAAGLEPNRYLLRASIPGTDMPAWSSLVVVLAGGGEGKVWAELLHAGDRPRAAAAGTPEPAPPAARRLAAGPVREAYRHVLERLAAGDEPAARRALEAFEAPLLAGPHAAASGEVATIEAGLAAELAAAEPRCLVPVTVLHEALYRDALERHESLLAAHARDVVFALADLAARQSGDADGRRTAARLLLGLAAHLVPSAPAGLAARTFQQILAYEEDNETAHLFLAAGAEREGRYPEAALQLERLLKGDPDRPDHLAEARIHLAVNLRRLGRTHDADKLLAGLLQSPPAAASRTIEPWVLALAYQETGRAFLAAGRLDDAERSLRDGLARLPGDEKLLLELAAVRDLRHEPAAARQALAGFKPGHAEGAGGESARHRYTHPSAAVLDETWAGLVRAAPEGYPALAAALKALPAKAGRSGP